MQSSCVHLHSSLASQAAMPLQHPQNAMPATDKRLSAITSPSVRLQPVHGLFESQLSGYRVDFHPTTVRSGTVRPEYTQQQYIRCLSEAVRGFLNSDKQGQLFMALPVSLLLRPLFIAELRQLIQQHASLHGKLVLLCQPDKLYPDLSEHIFTRQRVQSLSTPGIQLGLDIPATQPCWADSVRFEHPPCCILIRYADATVPFTELAATIRICRLRHWPMLVDGPAENAGKTIQ